MVYYYVSFHLVGFKIYSLIIETKKQSTHKHNQNLIQSEVSGKRFHVSKAYCLFMVNKMNVLSRKSFQQNMSDLR